MLCWYFYKYKAKHFRNLSLDRYAKAAVILNRIPKALKTYKVTEYCKSLIFASYFSKIGELAKKQILTSANIKGFTAVR